jgi:hypothetical protein
VIAGTATAVSNRVSRRQAGRWAEQEQAQAYEQQQYAQQSAQSQYAQPAAGPSDMDATIAKLKQLGELRSQGVLTDAEFEEQKGRLLNQ